jgi:hypothetical protein
MPTLKHGLLKGGHNLNSSPWQQDKLIMAEPDARIISSIDKLCHLLIQREE